MNKQDLNKLQKKIAYCFKNPDLLSLALTHRSFAKHNNERMEFLGDAVLSVIISNHLFHRFPKAQEGELSRLRANLVRGDNLSKIANTLGISENLHLGPGELKSGGEKRHSILADALEAIIAAIYLDSDIDTVKETLLKWFSPVLETLSLDSLGKDPKSELQEWLQARQLALPEYELIETCGKDHDQEFIVACSVVNLKDKIQGIGKSRRKAEQQAAKKVLEALKQ